MQTHKISHFTSKITSQSHVIAYLKGQNSFIWHISYVGASEKHPKNPAHHYLPLSCPILYIKNLSIPEIVKSVLYHFNHYSILQTAMKKRRFEV